MNRYMITASGRRVDLPEPLPTSIDPADVATHLSRINRFVGACAPYSVAQHSVAVAYMAVAVGQALHTPWTLGEALREGLLHDAAEFITGDVPSPVKALFKTEFIRATKPIERAIRTRFDLQAVEPHEVWLADKMLLAIEGRRLPAKLDIQYVPPEAHRLLERLPGNEWFDWAVRTASSDMTADFARREWLAEWERASGVGL